MSRKCILLFRRRAVGVQQSIAAGNARVCMFSEGVMDTCWERSVNGELCLGLVPLMKWLEKTLESSLKSKEIKPVNPKENQPRIHIGTTVCKAEAPILWPPDGKS